MGSIQTLPSANVVLRIMRMASHNMPSALSVQPGNMACTWLDRIHYYMGWRNYPSWHNYIQGTFMSNNIISILTLHSKLVICVVRDATSRVKLVFSSTQNINGFL